MFTTIFTFLSQKFLLIGAFMGSLYIFWLKRSETKAKEDAKDAHFVSLQAQATQDQVETLVEKAQNVMAQQTNVECSVCDRDSIHSWLSEQSHITSADSLSKASHPKPLLNDATSISKTTSKTR